MQARCSKRLRSWRAARRPIPRRLQLSQQQLQLGLSLTLCHCQVKLRSRRRWQRQVPVRPPAQCRTRVHSCQSTKQPQVLLLMLALRLMRRAAQHSRHAVPAHRRWRSRPRTQIVQRLAKAWRAAWTALTASPAVLVMAIRRALAAMMVLQPSGSLCQHLSLCPPTLLLCRALPTRAAVH